MTSMMKNPREETTPALPKMHRATRARVIAKLEEDLALLRAIRRWAAEARADLAAALHLPSPERTRRGRGESGKHSK